MIALAANILTSILCAAVLVQSVRMTRSLDKVKEGDLPRMVSALDKATAEARIVLSEMKRTLGDDCAEHARQVERARELRDELELITGIGNAAAERILDAVQRTGAPRDEDEAEGEESVEAADGEAPTLQAEAA
ncbi:MAG: DUF6468 domain-containing protein [Sphingomonas bacterium]